MDTNEATEAPALSGAIAAMAAFYLTQAESDLAAATAADDWRWIAQAERRAEHWRRIVASGGSVLGVASYDFRRIAAEHARIDPDCDASGSNAPWRDEEGHWAVYEVALSRGGSEEGGWWYEAGGLLACVRASRRVVCLDRRCPEYCDRVGDATMVPDDVLAVVLAMEAQQEPRHGFDGDVSRVHGSALRLVWCAGEQLPDAYFPTSRPSYE